MRIICDDDKSSRDVLNLNISIQTMHGGQLNLKIPKIFVTEGVAQTLFFLFIFKLNVFDLENICFQNVEHLYKVVMFFSSLLCM